MEIMPIGQRYPASRAGGGTRNTSQNGSVLFKATVNPSAVAEERIGTLNQVGASLQSDKENGLNEGITVGVGKGADLVSTEGNLCGSMTLAGVTSVAIGADNSVIGSSGTGGCTKVFWRQLLK